MFCREFKYQNPAEAAASDTAAFIVAGAKENWPKNNSWTRPQYPTNRHRRRHSPRADQQHKQLAQRLGVKLRNRDDDGELRIDHLTFTFTLEIDYTRTVRNKKRLHSLKHATSEN